MGSTSQNRYASPFDNLYPVRHLKKLLKALLRKYHSFLVWEKFRIKRLTIELPESEYNLSESYRLSKQESKRQVIRSLISSLSLKNNVDDFSLFKDTAGANT